jgi:glyoxylase-like metal-dependent hydrolase (beta-lactamase superfamily II)
MKRREFIYNSAGSLVLSLLAGKQLLAQPDPRDTPYSIKELRGGVNIFSEKGGTIAYLITKEGIVVVDAQFPEQSKHLIDELKKRSDRSLKYLINTHHHGDHSSGNIAYKGLVEHVVAHKNSLENQMTVARRNQNEDKQLYPDVTFNDNWKLKIGSERLTAYYYGEGHTNGDSIIHFENANVVHLGDLLFNKRYPFIDRSAGASIKHWILVLDRVQKTFDQETIYIFGHAFDPKAVTGSVSEINSFRNYFEKLLTFVGDEIKAGKDKDGILKATAIPGVVDMNGDSLNHSLQMAYEELTES